MQPQQPEPLPLLVCALIVSHNSVEALRRTVASLEASTGREQIEILVVDNGSSDGSQRIDSEFPEVTMLRLPHHCGLTKARNIGIRTAKAEKLLLLEAGIEVEPGTALALAERLDAESAQALAVTPLVVDATAGTVISKMYGLPSADQVSACWQDPRSLPAVPHAEVGELHDGRAILLRKTTIQGTNFLDERFGEHWGDVELAFQIKRAGKRILQASDVRVKLASDAAAAVWRPSEPGDRAAFAADAATGAAAYLGKHFGFAAGLGLRVKLILGALLRTVTFQDFGYNSGLLSRLMSGYKIDGSSQRF